MEHVKKITFLTPAPLAVIGFYAIFVFTCINIYVLKQKKGLKRMILKEFFLVLKEKKVFLFILTLRILFAF